MKNDIFRAATIGVLSFQLISCGTILYPERRNQKAGRLDVGVVLLDAIGLLFFLIPGIIAFAVDFSTGAIYLPASKDDKAKNQGKYRVVHFDPKNYTKESLEEIIRKETGQDFRFDDKQLKRIKLKDKDEMSFHFKEYDTNAGIILAEAVK